MRAQRADGFITGFVIRDGLTGHDTVRIRRTSTNNVGTVRIASAVWSVLRSIKSLDYCTMPNVTLLALRIKATDQISGTVSQFRGKCVSKLRPYLGIGQPGADADGFGAYAASRNPAWAFLHVLTGPEAQTPLSLDRIDLDRIKAWAAFCEPTPGNYDHAFDAVIDYSGTQFAVLQLIAGVARGNYATRDGKHSVVLDVPKPTPVQMFTPRNSWDYKGRRRFIDIPHALRVNFPNRLTENQIDELIVYDDGYDESNATKFETLEAIGITDSDGAWHHGRFHQRVARLRQEVHEITADVEYLVAEQGDRVLLSHDVPLKNTRFGRIVEIHVETGVIDWIRIDEAVELEIGVTYGIVIRWIKDGVLTLTSLTLNPIVSFPGFPGPEPGELGGFTTLQLNDADHAWQVGDLVAVGEVNNVTVDAIVQAVTPGQNLTATLLLTDYAGDSIFAGETPPAFDSLISAPLMAGPAAPLILNLQTIESAIVVTFTMPPMAAGRAPVSQVQAQYRQASVPVGQWIDLPSVLPTNSQVSVVLPVGYYYDLRIRSVSGSTSFSAWATRSSFAHVLDVYSADDFTITGFEVKNRGDDSQWVGGDLEVSWRLAVARFVGSTPPPGFNGFRVSILDASGVLRREDVVTDPRYNYSLARNQEDTLRMSSGVSAFGARTLKVRVAALDEFGDESLASLRTITNAAPSLPHISPFQTTLGINLYWGADPDPDATKILVFRGPTNALEATDETLIYAGFENPIFIDTSLSTDEWYRFARADEFSEDPLRLNVSPPQQIDPGSLVGEGETVPGTGAELTFFSEADPRILVAADWTPLIPPILLPSTSWHHIESAFALRSPSIASQRYRVAISATLSLGDDAPDDLTQFYAIGLAITNTPTAWNPFLNYNLWSVSRVALIRSATEAPKVVLSGSSVWPRFPGEPGYNAFFDTLVPDTDYWVWLSLIRKWDDNQVNQASVAVVHEMVFADFLLLK